jgi:protein transport protein SEC13
VSTVNSVCWGPYDFGLILACGSSDGAISLLTFTGEQQWDVKKISNAHTVSVSLSLSVSVEQFNYV